MSNDYIPFNRAYIAGRELYYIAQAVSRGELKGDGPFTKRCNEWLRQRFNAAQALLTHSCTAALEMAAHLLEIEPGDEVIMPSFTFTSTANAFVLRGAKPVFVDIRPDTLNMDEKQIEALITPRTKAICVMHYAGVACEMNEIMRIAKKHGLMVVEDAAHAIMSEFEGKPLGAIGDIGTFSFHETKNFSSGEGGALLLKHEAHINKAEIIREKGTNRSKFFRGEVDKYTWVDIGSSYLPSEIIAAFLYGQLEQADAIIDRRLEIWNGYYHAFTQLQTDGLVRLPIIPSHCRHNAHLFYLLLPEEKDQRALIDYLEARNVGAVFHYYPLHLSPMGSRFGYKAGQLPVTEKVAATLIRLPVFCGLEGADQARVIAGVSSYLETSSVRSRSKAVNS